MKRLFLSAVVAATLLSANAQDSTAVEAAPASTSELSISGSIDTYYRSNVIGDQGEVQTSSFANGNGFSLGMANVVLEKSTDKSGFVADLVFGPRGDDAVFNSAGNPAILNQLYAYWNVSDKVTLTLGNFNTFLGYEVISPTGNFNYSTSYMFSYGPFSHTGVKADISLTDQLSLMVGLLNPTDWTESNPINNVSLGVQLGYEADNGGAWLNFIGGNQQVGVGDDQDPLYQIDLTTGWDLTDAFYLGFNTSHQVQTTSVDGADPSSFTGVALYLQYALSDDFKLGVRAENFMESNYYLGTTAFDKDGNTSVTDLTLSANYTIGDLTLIPEFRIDLAGEETWLADGKGSKSLANILLAAVYAF